MPDQPVFIPLAFDLHYEDEEPEYVPGHIKPTDYARPRRTVVDYKVFVSSDSTIHGAKLRGVTGELEQRAPTDEEYETALAFLEARLMSRHQITAEDLRKIMVAALSSLVAMSEQNGRSVEPMLQRKITNVLEDMVHAQEKDSGQTGASDAQGAGQEGGS